MITKTYDHPSNVLYRGEATDAAHALQLLEDALIAESDLLRDAARAFEDLNINPEFDIATVRLMRHEYKQFIAAAEQRLFAIWQQQGGDSYKAEIAAHLASGSYENLAI